MITDTIRDLKYRPILHHSLSVSNTLRYDPAFSSHTLLFIINRRNTSSFILDDEDGGKNDGVHKEQRRAAASDE